MLGWWLERNLGGLDRYFDLKSLLQRPRSPLTLHTDVWKLEGRPDCQNARMPENVRNVVKRGVVVAEQEASKGRTVGSRGAEEARRAILGPPSL